MDYRWLVIRFYEDGSEGQADGVSNIATLGVRQCERPER